MKPFSLSRRGALAASALALGAPSANAAPKPAAAGPPELYELRIVKLRIGAQPKLAGDFYGKAWIPAVRKLGAGPVGVFNLVFGPETPTLYVLTTWPTFAAYERATQRLAAELAADQSPAARAYLDAPGTQPPFQRMDVQLLRAFDTFPKLVAPEKKARVLELRTYESPTEAGHARKMEMFGPKLGELEIFRRVGLDPVFFGRALTGPRLPSFTYGLVFADLAAREAAWAKFGPDPEWQKLRQLPGFADAEIMTNVTSLILRPTEDSQI
jgi:hypothetical protein